MKIDEPVLPIGKFEHADGDYDREHRVASSEGMQALLEAFCTQMIREINANAKKGGQDAYYQMESYQMVWQVLYHALKLAFVVFNKPDEDVSEADWNEWLIAVREFAADTANQAMFLQDNVLEDYGEASEVNPEGAAPTRIIGDERFQKLATSLAEWMRGGWPDIDMRYLTDSYDPEDLDGND